MPADKDKNKGYWREYWRRYVLARQQRWRANGCCVDCGKPSRFARCLKHRLRANKHQKRRYRRKKKANG